MTIQLDRHLFTLEEYERMIQAGVFQEDERLELIRGEIVEMAPIGFDHAGGVGRLTMLFAKKVSNSTMIWVQNPGAQGQNVQPCCSTHAFGAALLTGR